MIELRGISRIYRMGDESVRAVDNLDLTIADGEFLAIMGPSGSGKTTLANIISGLDSPSAGDVVIDSVPIRSYSDDELSRFRNGRIGFVFQTFNLQPGLTSLENVMLPLVLARIPRKERRQRAAHCLRLVGLQSRMQHRPSQLSGGERQRVSIARAIANNPRIVIADEPTGNLDTERGREIMQLLGELNREQKITLIVITHDASVAAQAGRVISMQDGRLVKADLRLAS